MRRSTDEFSKSASDRTKCPHCGRSYTPAAESGWRFLGETVIGLLAGVVLALMLVPLTVVAWKLCTGLLSDRGSRSILYHPLEDWTQY